MLHKSPLYRILVLFTLFCVMLTACTPASSLAPTATVPAKTTKSSVTATNTPEAIATPTKEAVDPNAPPEGSYTRQENGIYYIQDFRLE